MSRASSRNAVSLSSARTTKRFPSRRCPTVACSCCLAHGTRRNLTRRLRFNRGGWGSAVSGGRVSFPRGMGAWSLGRASGVTSQHSIRFTGTEVRRKRNRSMFLFWTYFCAKSQTHIRSDLARFSGLGCPVTHRRGTDRHGSGAGHWLTFLRMPGVNRQGQAHIVSTAIPLPRSCKAGREVEARPWFRTFSIDPQPASISPTINISIVFICALPVDCGRIISPPGHQK